MKVLTWIAVPLIAVSLAVVLFINPFKNEDIDEEFVFGTGTLTMPSLSKSSNESTILSECAKTACVAARAAEYKAQEEAERQAILAAEAEAARQAAEQSCSAMLAEWSSMYGGLPSYQRPPMPCGPYAGYSSAWTAGQAEWEAMSESEKIEESRRRGGTYGQPGQ